MINHHVFAHFTSTHIHAEDTPSMHHSHICLKSKVFVSIFTTRVLSAQELFAIEEMAGSGMGNKKIATTLGLPLSTTKRWLCRSKTQRKKRHSHVTRHSIALSTETDSTTNASFAKQVVEHAGSVGALTMSYMSTACRHIAQGRC